MQSREQWPRYTPRASIEPFYFGSSDKPLFGCYHTPQRVPRRDCAVVLCQAMGREYIQFHRAFRQLARLLSRTGFPVLRFDFYGCGDSSGDFDEGRIDRWVGDVSTAIGETRRICGAEQICLVGLRLGGTLAMIGGADRGDIDKMVLWDPVISGRAYMEELKALHQDMLRQAHVKVRHRPMDTGYREILGFPLTQPLLAGIERLNLLAIQRKPASDILLIETHSGADQQALSSHLSSIATSVAYQHLPAPRHWKWIEDFGQVLVPHQILESIVAWIPEVSE